MNTILLSTLVLLALTSYAFGIECSTQMCEMAKCEMVTEENCDGKVVPNGGFCGCCDACRTIIKEGGDCAMLHFIGVPPKAECDAGLICSLVTSKCEKPNA